MGYFRSALPPGLKIGTIGCEARLSCFPSLPNAGFGLGDFVQTLAWTTVAASFSTPPQVPPPSSLPQNGMMDSIIKKFAVSMPEHEQPPIGFAYTPLQTADSIHVVHLSRDGNTLRGRLQQVELSHLPKYCAMSYVWRWPSGPEGTSRNPSCSTVARCRLRPTWPTLLTSSQLTVAVGVRMRVRVPLRVECHFGSTPSAFMFTPPILEQTLLLQLLLDAAGGLDSEFWAVLGPGFNLPHRTEV